MVYHSVVCEAWLADRVFPGGCPQGPARWAGKTLPLAGDHARWSDIAKVLSEVTGKNVQGIDLPDEEFVAALQKAGLPEIGARDLANMFIYYR